MDRLRNISHHHGNCMPFVFSSWWICSSKRLELYWGNKTYQVPLDIRVSNLKGCFQIPTTAHFSLLRNKQHVLSRSRLTPWNSPSEAGTSRASRKDDGSPQRQRPTSALQGFPCSLKHRNCCMAKVRSVPTLWLWTSLYIKHLPSHTVAVDCLWRWQLPIWSLQSAHPPIYNRVQFSVMNLSCPHDLFNP